MTSGYADTSFLATISSGTHPKWSHCFRWCCIKLRRSLRLHTWYQHGTDRWHLWVHYSYSQLQWLWYQGISCRWWYTRKYYRRWRHSARGRKCTFTKCTWYFIFQKTWIWAWGDTTYDERLLESVIIIFLTAEQEVWVEPSSITTMYGSLLCNSLW